MKQQRRRQQQQKRKMEKNTAETADLTEHTNTHIQNESRREDEDNNNNTTRKLKIMTITEHRKQAKNKQNKYSINSLSTVLINNCHNNSSLHCCQCAHVCVYVRVSM